MSRSFPRRCLALAPRLIPARASARYAALALSTAAGALGGYYYAQSKPITPPQRYGSKSDFDNAIQELRAAFSDPHAVSTEAGTLLAHGFSMNDYHPGVPHTVVVFANSTEDVVQVVKIANKYKLPVVPFSGGTSLEGNFRAVSRAFFLESSILLHRSFLAEAYVSASPAWTIYSRFMVRAACLPK